MSWNSKFAAMAWMVLAALVSVVLVGCGSESTPRIPAPPPFVPASAVVTLGAEGGATTLISTQAGGWTHNGRDFTSGSTVRGENAATYRLTLSGGTWSAAFVSPDPARVRLGTSGDEVTLVLQEDGGYLLGTSAVQSGHVVMAGNGNQYRLALSTSGDWSAEFVPADPLRLALGISGDFVHIERREDRRFWLDNAELRSGRVVRAANGNRYTLALGTDGMWRALFVQPDPLRVALGQSGRTVLVTMLEQGTFELDGSPLWSGEVHETAGGTQYRFTLGTDGRWSATFVPEPETVHLGAHGGAIRVTRQENGRWTLGGETILSGHIVRSAVNRHSYRLILVDGIWRAEPQPMPIQVALQGTGGSIVLTQVEDGSYLYEGTAVSSGDVISVGSSTYLLTQAASGTWRAVRTVVPPGRPDPGLPLTNDTLLTYVGVSPRVRLTEDGSASTREGSILELNGLEYSVNALFTHGRDHREVTFAEEAHALITQELEDIEVLIGLAESAPGLRATIERRWDRIAEHLNSIFPGEGSTFLGLDTPKERNGGIDYEEVIEDIEDVLAALNSSSAFETALDEGIFSRSRRVDVDDSEDTFYAVRSATRLGFGWTPTTRYGAFSKQERSAISRTLDFASGTEGIGAFAYSPLESTRTRELPASGEAYYIGETIAASRQSDQAIFSGDFELRVRFASRSVTALVTDLQDDHGRLWRYSLQDVDSIRLPTARLSSSDGSFEPVSSGTASVLFSPISIRFSTRSLSADFEGRFVGRGADAGQSAIGTWSLSSSGNVLLAGGFGAHSQDAPIRPPPVERPVHPSPDLGEVAETWLVARPDGDGNIDIAARDSNNRRIELAASELSANGGAIVAGERLFDKARAVLQNNLVLLNIYIDIFDSSTSQALQNRQALWRSTNEALQDSIFGRSNVLGANYPSGSRLSDRDEDAIELLQDAYHALGGALSFRDAVEDGGVFDGVLSPSMIDDGDYDFSEISEALEYEVEVEYDNTDYGRFGVWSKRVRANALSPVTAATGTERGDAFAYSQIGQTLYSSNDPNFPRGFTSSYVGRTVAVDTGSDGPTFYQGDISLAVGWNSSSPVGSRVTTVIENLARTDTGEPLLHNGYEVKDLIFGNAAVRLDSLNQLEFGGYSSVRVRYFDLSRSERSYGSGESEGKFVGYHPSGPLGVIGTWDLDGSTIKGAFGADLAP